MNWKSQILKHIPTESLHTVRKKVPKIDGMFGVDYFASHYLAVANKNKNREWKEEENKNVQCWHWSLQTLDFVGKSNVLVKSGEK